MRDLNDIILGIEDEKRRRTAQKDILPATIQPRNFASLAEVTSIASASTTTDTGQQHVITVTLTSGTGDDFVAAEVYTALYIDTLTGANLLPGGSGVDESQWQFDSPRFAYNTWDGSVDEAIVTLYVRNISAGAHTLLFRTRTKYLSNKPKGEAD